MHDGESHQSNFAGQKIYSDFYFIYLRLIQYILGLFNIFGLFPNLILWSVFQNSVSVLEKLR